MDGESLAGQEQAAEAVSSLRGLQGEVPGCRSDGRGSGSSCTRRSEVPHMMGAEDEAARSGWMGERGVFSLML